MVSGPTFDIQDVLVALVFWHLALYLCRVLALVLKMQIHFTDVIDSASYDTGRDVLLSEQIFTQSQMNL